MNRSWQRWMRIAVFAASAAWMADGRAFAAGKQSFTGEVGDSMCGKKHMEGTADACTRTCVKGGSKYALIVGDKVYTLETTDKDALATLDKQAGKNATVSGTLKGDAIEVSSVATAK